jgi:DNA-binding CsgD family transcriptional regulator
LTEQGITFEESHQINEAILLIGEGLSSSTNLQQFLTEFLLLLRKQIYFDKGNFMFYECDNQHENYSVNAFPHVGWNQDDIDLYVDAYAQMDDILPVMTERENIVILNRNIFSKPIDKTTKYYKEFIKPKQLFNSIHANFPLKGDADFFAKISIFRDSARRPFTAKDVEIIKIYQPHISNLLNKQLVANGISSMADVSRLLKSFHSVGICVLDINLNVLTVNDMFHHLISKDRDTAGAIESEYELVACIKDICAKIHDKTDKISSELTEIHIKGNKSHYVEVVRHKESEADIKYVCLIYNYSNFLDTKLSTIRKKKFLTEREGQILSLILHEAYSAEDLAQNLHISKSTVKKHISSIYRKLGVTCQKQLTSMLIEGL